MSLPVGICYNIRPSPSIFPFPTSGCRLKRPLRGERGESDFHQIPSCSRFSLEGDEKIKKAHHAISRSAPTIARKRVWEIVGVPFSSFFGGARIRKCGAVCDPSSSFGDRSIHLRIRATSNLSLLFIFFLRTYYYYHSRLVKKTRIFPPKSWENNAQMFSPVSFRSLFFLRYSYDRSILPFLQAIARRGSRDGGGRREKNRKKISRLPPPPPPLFLPPTRSSMVRWW